MSVQILSEKLKILQKYSKLLLEYFSFSRTLFFFGLAKVLYMAFSNHLGIMLMTFVVDYVEKEWLCHAVDLDFIIAHVNMFLL